MPTSSISPRISNYRWVPAPTAALLDKFDKATPAAIEALKETARERWDHHWQLVSGNAVNNDDTRYNIFRNCVIDHGIHHRAQLGMNLRMLDAWVPGLYGPFADES